MVPAVIKASPLDAAERLRRRHRHQVDLDPGEQAARYGADLDLLVWDKRLRCSQRGSRNVDSIVAPDNTGGLGDR